MDNYDIGRQDGVAYGKGERKFPDRFIDEDYKDGFKAGLRAEKRSQVSLDRTPT